VRPATNRARQRQSPLSILLKGLAALLGVLLLGTLGPTAAQARPAQTEAAAIGLHISNGRLLECRGGRAGSCESHADDVPCG